MVFSSISFLYYFLPIVLIAFHIAPKRIRNIVLLISSMAFYFYGEPVYIILMIFSALLGYIHGLLIDKFRGNRLSKIAMISSVIMGIGLLMFFKYSNFFIENVNALFDSNIGLISIALPIGISFYTFQILSYTIEVYKGNAKVQKNFIKLAVYVTLFPQLIAGPIVRYTTISDSLDKSTISFADFAYGVRRFVLGLSKKVLIANVLGELNGVLINVNEKTIVLYWIYALSFALQIYFDFSGYSDMAIGLGRMLGFHFLENFNYPYIAKSITEFWRRWHISMSTWFRDYIYIPMGGNRVGKSRWLFNIFVVWFVTGFWHGAAWNFILWGLYFAVILVAERFIIKKVSFKLPSYISHIYVLFIVIISFTIFNADSMGDIQANLGGMFGIGEIPFINMITKYYLRSYGVIFITAFIGATPLTKIYTEKLRDSGKTGALLINILEPIVLMSLLLLVTAYLVDGSFNPFLYFRF